MFALIRVRNETFCWDFFLLVSPCYHNAIQSVPPELQQLCQNHFQMFTQACTDQSTMHIIPMA